MTKINIWNYTRKPKSVLGELGHDFAVAMTDSKQLANGMLSEINGNLETVKQNGGKIIEKNGKIYVAFNHFDLFESDIKSITKDEGWNLL